MSAAEIIAALSKMPPDAIVESWNGITDEPMPVTRVELCDDGTISVSSLTPEQLAD